MIRRASTPAFFAPSIATQATGIPGGICTAESSASSPPRLLPRIGTPITGRSVWAAATPGSAALMPAPAMITFSPFIRAFWQYSRTFSGSRWALITWTSDLMPCSERYFSAGSIFSMSFFDPMMIPTSGPEASKSCSICSIWTSVCVSGVMSLMSSSRGWLGTGNSVDGAGGDVGADLHPVEGDPPRGIVRTIARRGRVGAEPGDVEHAAAGGDDLAVALGGARVGHLGQLRRLGEPVDHVARRGAFRVAGRGQHHGHRPVVVEVGAHPGEAARLARGAKEVEEVGAQPRQHRLRLGVAQASN